MFNPFRVPTTWNVLYYLPSCIHKEYLKSHITVLYYGNRVSIYAILVIYSWTILMCGYVPSNFLQYY